MDEPTAPLTGKDAEGLFRTIRKLRDKRRQRHLHLPPAARNFRSHRPRHRDARRPPRLHPRHPATTQDELVRAMVGEDLKARITGDCRRLPAANRRKPCASKAPSISSFAAARWSAWPDSPARAGPNCSNGCSAPIDGPAQPRPRQRPPVTSATRATPSAKAWGSSRTTARARVSCSALRSADNISLPGRRDRLFLRSADERREAGQLMGELRIRAVSLDQPLRYLSGGNQQKAVLAKWLSAGSSIFLLDEPTRGVDVRSKGGNLRHHPRPVRPRLRRPARPRPSSRSCSRSPTASWSCTAAGSPASCRATKPPRNES